MDKKPINKMTVLERATAPTPQFFRILRIMGITLAAASGTLLAAPVAMPAILTTIASYVAVAGAVVTAVSQVTVES
jgi:hypothetical protein